MFAILKTGGKQYKVAKEEKLLIDKIDGNIGDEVVFNAIIMINDNGKTEIGSPLVKDAAVVAEVIKQTRGPKITIIYKRRRKNSRRKQGHKQDLTLVKIKNIAASGGSKIVAKKAEVKEVKKETKTKQTTEKKETAKLNQKLAPLKLFQIKKHKQPLRKQRQKKLKLKNHNYIKVLIWHIKKQVVVQEMEEILLEDV